MGFTDEGYGKISLDDKCLIPDCYSPWEFFSDDGIKLCKYHYFYLGKCPNRLNRAIKYGNKFNIRAFSRLGGRNKQTIRSIETLSKNRRIGKHLIY